MYTGIRFQLASGLLRVLLALAALQPAILPAQSFPTTGPGVVTGTMVDSATGIGIPRSMVCAEFRMASALWTARCAAVDSAGRFRLENLPAGRHVVTGGCLTRGQFGTALASDSVEFTDPTPRVRHWRVEGSGCYTAFPRSRTGELRGHYSFGFEESNFSPCPSDAWYFDDDSLSRGARGRWTWVTLAKATAAPTVRWPSRANREAYPRYYVHWRGTVTGPDYYGHLGGSRYLLSVDSVIEVRLPGEADCR